MVPFQLDYPVAFKLLLKLGIFQNGNIPSLPRFGYNLIEDYSSILSLDVFKNLKLGSVSNKYIFLVYKSQRMEYSNFAKISRLFQTSILIIRGNNYIYIFTSLFSVHNTVSLSRHEQVCLIRLRFEGYFSHHRPKHINT